MGMGGWKIEHMNITGNDMGKLSNHALSIKSEAEKIIYIYIFIV